MGADRTSYRTPVLLCTFVLLGWALDFGLGGGIVHSAAWLLALVLVGGISTLSVRSARAVAGHEAATIQQRPEGDPARNADWQPPAAGQAKAQATGSGAPPIIRPACPDELGQLIDVEVAADQLFPLAGYGATPGPASVQELAAAPLLLVAGEPAVGYVRVEIVDGQAHIEGLSVRPRYMRQGIGTALVEAACAWATEQGFAEVTLCTFAEVPWNGPFYAGLGFVEVSDPSPGLRRLRETEAQLGLDAMGRRIVMVRRTGTLDG